MVTEIFTWAAEALLDSRSERLGRTLHAAEKLVQVVRLDAVRRLLPTSCQRLQLARPAAIDAAVNVVECCVSHHKTPCHNTNTLVTPHATPFTCLTLLFPALLLQRTWQTDLQDIRGLCTRHIAGSGTSLPS